MTLNAYFCVAKLGGNPLPPLTENHSAQKLITALGGNQKKNGAADLEVSGRTATSADSKTGAGFRDPLLFFFCCCFYLSCSFFFVFVYRFTSATFKNLEQFCVTNCCCCVHSVQRKGTRRASSLEVETLLSPALFCSNPKASQRWE